MTKLILPLLLIAFSGFAQDAPSDKDRAEARLPATIVATVLAILNGADIIRTHDVEDTYRMLSVINRILQNNNENKSLSTYEI